LLFTHSGHEAAEAAVNALKLQALGMAKSAPSKILDLVLAFCTANAQHVQSGLHKTELIKCDVW
jgi:hypothetical protein